jgi:hypothetical protein
MLCMMTMFDDIRRPMKKALHDADYQVIFAYCSDTAMLGK